MATGQTICDRAARLLGELPPNSTLPADESADALVALNALLDSLRNDVGMCFAFQDESVTMVGGRNPYALGPTGDLVTTRPVSIEDAYIVRLGSSYGVRIIEDDEYDGISLKASTANWPDRANYRPTMPNGSLYVYPVSDGTTATLHLRTRVPLTSLALTDTVSLPPGWEDLLASSLAIVMGPEYQTEPSPAVMRMAALSKAAIKRANQRPMRAYTGLGSIASARRPNIITNQS